MTDALTHYNQPPAPARPAFLTVLCILTFIGSGYGIIRSATQYFTADKQAAAYSLVTQQADSSIAKMDTLNNGGAKMATQVISYMGNAANPAKIKKAALASIIASIFCLIGAFLMWGLKRNGFYFYIIGTLAGILTPFVLFGSNLLAIGTSGFIGFIGVLFIVLYGVNLKHMNK
jgi:hypothetical protein